MVLGAIGANAFWLLYLWLGSASLCAILSERKGYTEKAGLGSGLLLSVVGVLLWLVIPARPNSRWANRRERKRAGGDA